MVERFHSGENVRDQGFVGGGKDLVSDSEVTHDDFQEEGEEVGGEPSLCGRERGEGVDVDVGDCGGDRDISANEGAENGFASQSFTQSMVVWDLRKVVMVDDGRSYQ